MKLKDNSTQEIDTALYQLEQKLKSNIRFTDVENSNASTAKINAVDKKLTEEIKDRQSADEKLQDNINKEIADRQDADAAIENAKQDKLIAGNNIQIDGNVISATSKEYTAEAPVKVTDGKISLDTVPVTKGGTGATTAKEAEYNIVVPTQNATLDAEPIGDEARWTGTYLSPSKTTGRLYTKKFNVVWEYIKGKISSVLGLTETKLTLQGGTVSSNSYTDTNPKLEFKNNDGSQNISLTFTDFDAVQEPASLTLNGNQGNEYFIAPNIKATGSFYGNLSGKADTAGTADYARNMYYQNLDLLALDKTKFYPLVCYSGNNFAEVAICSESGMGSAEYNQNRIHFDISTMGWSDLPPTLNIREYACYDNNEITIGCIGRGVHNGAWAIWLRGGLHYTCFSRNADLSLHTSDYTFGDETYTVGTNYYGGSNTNVSIMFTPQSTITEGAYSSRQITAPNIKADYRMVIPIGAPSSLEDGCIWVER